MNLLIWNVHGSYTNALVRGNHHYFIPSLPEGGPLGGGIGHYRWPENVVPTTPTQLKNIDIDLVILQRPEEVLNGMEMFLPRRIPGIDIPVIYLEHNTPQGLIAKMQHPISGQSNILLVHVTHFNQLMWESTGTPSIVIEHGIPDPGYLYKGTIPHAVTAINEARRRNRIVGFDLLQQLHAVEIPIDIFGIDSEALGGENLHLEELHQAMGARRVYFHPFRWTSLGLSLIEAMMIGMPIVALDVTEASEALNPEVAVLSNRFDTISSSLRRFIDDIDECTPWGERAREYALERFGLQRFLQDWDLAFDHATSLAEQRARKSWAT